jgi:hypothetical protein
MKKLIPILLALFVITSCEVTPEVTFERDGVLVTSPKGWKITDEENFDDQGYYLAIEKDGFDSSGLVAITWIKSELDLVEWMSIIKDEMKDNLVYKNSNLSFENQSKGKFNGINTTSVPYTSSILGLKHEGIIHVFHENGNTFEILIQEALEDKVKNRNGFEQIEQSFKIK